MTIAKIGSDQTISYAFDELVRCLKAMNEKLLIDGRFYDHKEELQYPVLWVGLDGSMDLSVDDAIRIDVKNGTGVITGSNERSVLIAVYRFLYELGCRFLKPGKEGEWIPQKDIEQKNLSVQVEEKASYRHRGVCIEGGNSYEHIRDMIDWLPKVGMNGYFVQFHTPYIFFERWYHHENNPLLEKEPLTPEDVTHIWKRLEEEVVKRGLLYHAVGHGWTCEPLGIKGGGWDVETGEIAPEVKQYFAEVNGKRELWGGIGLNTNLCYSKPEVRNMMTDAIANYCKSHREVDYLHFWLADASNNQCECPECQKMRPSDFYVMLLNELDQKLTEENIPVKVVFLIYVDLLWAPEVLKIKHPDRFVLMFAPITRTYTTAFTDFDVSKKDEPTPYVRNKLVMPQKVSENLAYLNAWQEQFPGDSFDFDYHLMWDHVLDPGYYECSRILHKDMTNLDKIGLNGMVSCQAQRVFFPTGLPMYAMAKGLWDKTSEFDQIAEEYFQTAFGEDGETVREYLKKLSELFMPPYLRFETPQVDEAAAESFQKAGELAESFLKEVMEKKEEETRDWKYLSYHARICMILARMLRQRAMGQKDLSNESLQELLDYLNEIEMDTDKVLDVCNYQQVMKRFLDEK